MLRLHNSGWEPMRSRTALAHLILGLMLTTSMLAGPVDVAQRVTNALFVEPLRIQNAEFVISTEAFAAECVPHALIVKVLVPAKSGRREVLKVSMVIVADRLEFLSAKGTALDGAKAVSGDEVTQRSLRFLAGLNGWRTVEEPLRHVKPGYLER
jgi:hypothetical protein